VTGFGEEAGAPLAAHPDVDKVAFTGSTEVGKLIVQAAAGNLKKVTLELGGKSPNVVFSDADLSHAVPGAASAIFFNHGQCCCAGSRLFVEHSIFDDVVQGVSDAASSITVGSGFHEKTEMGPLVSEEQLRRVTAFMESGIAEGAEAVVGGKRKGDRGYFVEPTVFVNTHDQMKIVQEEIFGPVVTAMPFKDLDEVAKIANTTTYGLGAGVWTSDISKAHRLANRIKAGTVWINSYNIFDADAILLRGAAASEAAFKRDAPSHRVIHVATHAFFLGVSETPGENPLLVSGLALAGANHRDRAAAAGEEDGILTAEEIASLDLSGTDWAVLSACDSGVGEIVLDQGVSGLRRAFQTAGVGTLIMSLWPVDDRATLAWMEALYRSRLEAGASTVEAVRAATRQALRARREAGSDTHPFTWGAFVAAGDWR